MPDPVPGPGRRAARCVLPGRNPLVRASDRLEAASWVAALLAVLLALPVALTVGTVVRTELAARAQEQAATRQQVTGVLLQDAPPPRDGFSAARPVPTEAAWTGPDGGDHRGTVPAPVGAQAGDPVPVWVDADGQRVGRPLDRGDLTVTAVVAGVVVFLDLVAAVAAGLALVDRLLWRHRARQWAAGWAAVEPGWAGRADR